MEPIRPLPRPSWLDRARAAAEFVQPARLVTAAGSVLLVAAGCWWLLRAPAPNVEGRLPFAAAPSSTVAGGPPSTVGVSSVPATLVGAPATASVPVSIVVQVSGAVHSPGVYSVPVGARVHDAIARAGGALPDGDPHALALAFVLADGERVFVPTIGGSVPGSPVAASRTITGPATGSAPGGATGSTASSGPIDLNQADAVALDSLPGIGPATAAAIIAHRDQNGPFGSVDDLGKVRGIGPAKLDALRGLVTT